MMRLHRSFVWAAMLSAGTLALAPSLAAQSSGNGFLFRRPAVSFDLRAGFAHASAGSDIFSFSEEQFTLGSGDFSGPAVAGEMGIHVTPRVQLVLGSAYTGRQARSEYRDLVEEVNGVDQPIEQTTTFVRVPATASVKAYLVPPGRTIGKFAWVPSRYAPFVGAGGGGMWYRFRQEGDFVNMDTNVIRSDQLDSQGWTKTAHAFAGLDYSLSPRFAITSQARYDWAEATLDEFVFEGFEPIDLSGLSATVGIHIRL
jgi:hypothetical protein